MLRTEATRPIASQREGAFARPPATPRPRHNLARQLEQRALWSAVFAQALGLARPALERQRRGARSVVVIVRHRPKRRGPS